MPTRPQSVLFVVLAVLASASMWFYVDVILVGHQVADAAANERPRGNLSDLYPRWLGSRELLLHGRNPYSPELTLEIQKGYYGRVIDPTRPNDPKDQQGFAYPVYVAFLLAPLIGFSFHTVQIFFGWLLIAVTAASILLWLRALQWRLPCSGIFICIALMLGSVPGVQGIKLQQLSLVVAAMLAASAACVASGYLFCGGILLALATIKPQLAWPLVAWLLIWAVMDWRARRRFVFGFGLTMILLFAGAEFILPGWWRMFLEAIRRYRDYTHSQSVLDQLVDWMVGPHGGNILAGIAVLLSVLLLWKLHREMNAAQSFGAAVALVPALTVLIVPMYAPYNQVLLLPAILWLLKDYKSLTSGSVGVRFTYVVGICTLAWPWLASLGLSILYLLGRHAEAMNGWKAPFYATFALPVLVFALTVVSVRRQGRILRVSEPTE